METYRTNISIQNNMETYRTIQQIEKQKYKKQYRNRLTAMEIYNKLWKYIQQTNIDNDGNILKHTEIY